MEQQKETFSTAISLKKRSELNISGVSDIISSDENSIYLNTADGTLTVEGADLRIISIDVSGGYMNVEGKVDSLVYNDRTQTQKSGFLARMFK